MCPSSLALLPWWCLAAVLLRPDDVSACVIVNINGSIDGGEIVSACLRERGGLVSSRGSAGQPDPGGTSSDSNRENSQDINATQEKTTGKRTSTCRENCSILSDPQISRMFCVFVSGFFLATGLIFIGVIGLGDGKCRRPEGPIHLPAPIDVLSSSTDTERNSTQSSDRTPELGTERGSSNRAEFGSTVHNHPYRSVAALHLCQDQPSGDIPRESCRPRVSPGLGSSRAREEAAANGCSRSMVNLHFVPQAGLGGVRSRGAAADSSHSSSHVALNSEEFWL